jgi:hypothetical protein
MVWHLTGVPDWLEADQWTRVSRMARERVNLFDALNVIAHSALSGVLLLCLGWAELSTVPSVPGSRSSLCDGSARSVVASAR